MYTLYNIIIITLLLLSLPLCYNTPGDGRAAPGDMIGTAVFSAAAADPLAPVY